MLGFESSPSRGALGQMTWFGLDKVDQHGQSESSESLDSDWATVCVQKGKLKVKAGGDPWDESSNQRSGNPGLSAARLAKSGHPKGNPGLLP